MLGLRQSLVTTGKVGGGLIKTDIGDAGSLQDGGTLLLQSPKFGNTQSVAYTVMEYPIQLTVGGIRSYLGTWEQCKDFAHAQSFISKKSTDQTAKFVGACEYTGQTGTSDPRFKIYPKLYLDSESPQFPLLGFQEEIPTTQAPIIVNIYPNNLHTHLLRLWWETYYLQNPEKYPSIRYIWGPRVSETSDLAYIFCVEDGNEYLDSVTARHSFLLFRSYTYNTFVTTETVPEGSPNASVPKVANGKAYTTATNQFETAIYGFNNAVVNPIELKKFPVELEVICDFNNTVGIFNIPAPFDKFKTVTDNQGRKNFDGTQAPGVTIKVSLIYADRTLIYGTLDDPLSYYVYPDLNLQFTYNYWGSTPVAFTQQTIQVPNGSIPGKIKYTFRFLLDMSTLPGFESGRSAAIIGPISLYDFKFKFPNYKESNPITYSKYIAGQRYLYLINKPSDTFAAEVQTNTLLLNRFLSILQGNSI